MRIGKLAAILVILTLILLMTASCRSGGNEKAMQTAAPDLGGPLGDSEVKPDEHTTGSTLTSEPTNHSVTLYGDIENLDPTGQVVVCWHGHTQAREELLLSMIDEFNRVNEWNIAVFAKSQGGYKGLHDRIIDGIQSSRLPSLALTRQHRAATYAVHSALVSLSPYVESKKWGYPEEELEDFSPTALTADILPLSQARYGWPLDMTLEVMYYNKDWLTELGYTDPPATWDEFTEMACAASVQPFSSATGDDLGFGYVYDLTPSWLTTLIFSQGGTIMDEDGTNYTFDSPEGLGALALLKNLVDQGCAAEQTGNHGDLDFGTGRSLFTIDPTSRLPDYESAVGDGAGFAWSIAPPPYNHAGPWMNPSGTSHFIFVSSPEEQLAAWLFVKWMSEPEQQATWTMGTGYLPVRQAVASLLADYFVEHPAYETALTFAPMDYGKDPSVLGYDECRAVIAEMFASAPDFEDVQAQLELAVERCNESLRMPVLTR